MEKTTLVLNTAAKLSKGECLDDDMDVQEPVNVIYQTAEDGLADTVKPRLELAGADCEKILVIDESDKSLSMADERLEEALANTGAKVLILDPIQAYLGGGMDINRANEARDMTKKLGALAEKYQCAMENYDLKEKQFWLQVDNEELEQKNYDLQYKNDELENANDQLHLDNHTLEQKNEALQSDNQILGQRYSDLQQDNIQLEKQQNELKSNIEQMVQSEQLLQRDIRKYDEAPEWQLPEPGAFASAKSFRDKVVMPFVNKLKSLIKNLTIQCVRLKEEVLQLRKEKKRLSEDVEFYKGKIKDMSGKVELLQEKADNLERVKEYAGAEQIDTIIRKVKEQERTEQQIRQYNRSYGAR